MNNGMPPGPGNHPVNGAAMISTPPTTPTTIR